MGLLVNIDVPELEAAIGFYAGAFGLVVSRRLGSQVAELTGWPVPVYLLENPEGTVAAGLDRRRYARHWTPLHLDIVVDHLDAALARAIAAGARLETGPRSEIWGRMATLADPFGHGLCLIQFNGRGYDAIATTPSFPTAWSGDPEPERSGGPGSSTRVPGSASSPGRRG